MDEPEPEDKAFCTLLWTANGGRVDARGRPIFRNDERVLGNCLQPGDCATCEHMQRTLASMPAHGVSFMWICPACMSQVRESARDQNIEMQLAGFYTEGYCQRPQCCRGEVGSDERYSPILQLLTFNGPINP